ncbi:glutaminyl-tRNA synthetase [Gonapodya prolifera JEL478]|uniref:glutamine--tRNA ligase n=1 Tax=Gonapodya prolifera (strain JEL478) TaxID=1344416 RepID=A0A139ASI2_GONPJ|nr:glutaminyl-tRNA synthetase [Gonapodya prolifera JEL478]|eukprot:KXS19659.1 glutaminyl-tRNA synthetase [Gonapodya prolifera JEL478]
MATELASLFVKIGLTEPKAKETASNKKIGPALKDLITLVGFEDGAEKSKGVLLYTLASTVTPEAQKHIAYIARAIADGRIASTDQLAAAVKFADRTEDPTIDDIAFNKECGVGVEVSPTEITAAVAALLSERAAVLASERYRSIPGLLKEARERLRWANAKLVKDELDRQVAEAVGPKDERDDPKLNKKKEAKPAKTPAPTSSTSAAASSADGTPTEPRKKTIAEAAKSMDYVLEGELSRLHKPGGNKQIKPELMKEHLKATGGKVLTRFPPEPNGFLHIGHAKAMNVNFGYAEAHGGHCYLRYDDTNPEAEEPRYFDAILEMVTWLGFRPWKITYASEHFQRLYDLAVELIKKDKAFVCHCTGEDMHRMRGGESGGERTECPHRNRPIAESVREFERMKEGRYGEGEATLRMKMDMQSGNPQFWDLVAYRVMYTRHVRTGDAWCIYPTYDYVHCLCDSFENITHSLCTLEFRNSRESYYWLVDALEIYKPVQFEYARLNLTNMVMSKRKLKELVERGHVSGWDDPRMYTLMALRRRGFTPTAINAFVRDLGVTTVQSTVDMSRLDNYVREHLNDIAPRLMVVLEPLRVVLTNVPDDYLEEITVPNKPRDDTMGHHMVPFTRFVYIESADFREKDDPNYLRLAPGKTIGLLNVPFTITAVSYTKDEETGRVTEVQAIYGNNPKAPKKAKTYIHWVADSPKHSSPVNVEVRAYANLFLHSNPDNKEEVPGGYLSDINPDSLKVYPDAFAEVGVRTAKVGDKFQFLRTGYYCVDYDSKVEEAKFVFNRTVSLKEDAKKDT